MIPVTHRGIQLDYLLVSNWYPVSAGTQSPGLGIGTENSWMGASAHPPHIAPGRATVIGQLMTKCQEEISFNEMCDALGAGSQKMVNDDADDA